MNAAAPFPLPPVVDAAAVAALKPALLIHTSLDGAAVSRVDTLGAQLLLCAALAAQARGEKFVISPSPALQKTMDALGLTPHFTKACG